MKPRTEKPSDEVMRFFTRDLYLRFNSPRDDEAHRADETWEAAIRAYHRHLNQIRDKLPPDVRKLAKLCLHDAELLACNEAAPHNGLAKITLGTGRPVAAVAVLSLPQNDKLLSLIYFLWDRIREHHPTAHWPFSKSRKHWLYDELDLAPNQRGRFLHRILMSDGTVLEIPFISLIAHTFPLPAPADHQHSRQIA